MSRHRRGKGGLYGLGQKRDEFTSKKNQLREEGRLDETVGCGKQKEVPSFPQIASSQKKKHRRPQKLRAIRGGRGKDTRPLRGSRPEEADRPFGGL